MHYAGDSEFRAVTLANGILQHSTDCPILLARKGIAKEIADAKLKGVRVVEHAEKNPRAVEDVDCLIVINSDSRELCTTKYWQSKKINLHKVKTVCFLFNFIVSPSISLPTIRHPNLRIAVTNNRFYYEVKQSRYNAVRLLPRTVIRSPIDHSLTDRPKTESAVIRIGRHAKPINTKFNVDTLKLVREVNRTHSDLVKWDFMGVPEEHIEELKEHPNVTVRKEFSMLVGEYLQGIDVFLHFTKWRHQEPWSRAVAESMVSRCAIVTIDTDGGNRDQVLDGNTGYLCKDMDRIIERCSWLVKNPETVRQMGRNANLFSRQFTVERVVQHLLDFIR